MDREIVCCFAGHRDCDESIRKYVSETVEKLITEYSVKKFLVGNYGAFDRICASVVSQLKKIHSDINLELVIPYVTKSVNIEKNYYSKYDAITIADIPLSTPKKIMIVKTNEYMVKRSRFLICFVNRSWGGAAVTVEFAKKQGIDIINIAKTD